MKWKTKHKILQAFDFLPDRLYQFVTTKFWNSGNLNLSEGVPEVWDFHLHNLKAHSCNSLIEFGAGKHLGQNIWLASAVPHQVVLDINRMLNFDLLQSVIEQLSELEEFEQVQMLCCDENLLKKSYGIDYIAPLDLLNFNPGYTFDATVSSSTYEHIPEESIMALLAKLRKLLSPGGLFSAHIDYSDHYSHSDASIDRLNFLSYTESEWKKYSHKNFYQNRLRHMDYMRMFEKAGFSVVEANASNYVESPKKQPLMENLTGHPSDFATTGRWVLVSP